MLTCGNDATLFCALSPYPWTSSKLIAVSVTRIMAASMFRRILGPIVCFAVIVSLNGCGHQCSSELVQSSQSDDGRIEIRFEKKNCGATTDFIYELKSIEPSGGHGDIVLRFDSSHRADWPDDDKKILDLRWLSGSQLEVDLHVPVRIFYESRTLNDLPVQYRYQVGTNKI
jgi:hypothetical protein